MEMPWRPGLKTCSGTDSVGISRQSAGAEDPSHKVTVFTGNEGYSGRKEQRVSSPLGRFETREHFFRTNAVALGSHREGKNENVSSSRDYAFPTGWSLLLPAPSNLLGIRRPAYVQNGPEGMSAQSTTS